MLALVSVSCPWIRPMRAQGVPRHDGLVLLSLLETEVEGAHRLLVEGAGQEAQGGADLGRRLAPHERRGFVGREEAAVVLQNDQVVGDQQGVGRVDVDRVDLPRSGRLVLEGVLEGLDRGEVEPVDPLQTEEAVLAPHELVAEAAAQTLRDPGEVGDRLQPLALGKLLGHGDLEGVLEAEGGEPPEVPAVEELGAHPVQRLGRPALRGLVQDRDEPGARVLRVDVDRAGLQGLEADLRPREPEPALHFEIGPALQELGEDLAQEPALLEVLRADHDAVGGEGGGGEEEGEEKKPHPLSPSPARRERGDVAGAVLPWQKARRLPLRPPSPRGERAGAYGGRT